MNSDSRGVFLFTLNSSDPSELDISNHNVSILVVIGLSLKERPYLAIALFQKKNRFQNTCILPKWTKMCTFDQNALKYLIFSEKSHLASRF